MTRKLSVWLLLYLFDRTDRYGRTYGPYRARRGLGCLVQVRLLYGLTDKSGTVCIVVVVGLGAVVWLGVVVVC